MFVAIRPCSVARRVAPWSTQARSGAADSGPHTPARRVPCPLPTRCRAQSSWPASPTVRAFGRRIGLLRAPMGGGSGAHSRPHTRPTDHTRAERRITKRKFFVRNDGHGAAAVDEPVVNAEMRIEFLRCSHYRCGRNEGPWNVSNSQLDPMICVRRQNQRLVLSAATAWRQRQCERTALAFQLVVNLFRDDLSCIAW